MMEDLYTEEFSSSKSGLDLPTLPSMEQEDTPSDSTSLSTPMFEFNKLEEIIKQRCFHPKITNPYLTDIHHALEVREWEKALKGLDELEELLDLDLFSERSSSI